jgi:hypothetical protein
MCPGGSSIQGGATATSDSSAKRALESEARLLLAIQTEALRLLWSPGDRDRKERPGSKARRLRHRVQGESLSRSPRRPESGRRGAARSAPRGSNRAGSIADIARPRVARNHSVYGTVWRWVSTKVGGDKRRPRHRRMGGPSTLSPQRTPWRPLPSVMVVR